MMRSVSAALLSAALLVAIPVPAPAQRAGAALLADAGAAIDTLALRSHTRFLADDLLRGRGAGTEGERLAAAYIESQLIGLGIAPLEAGYQLEVPLVSARVEAATAATLRRGNSVSSFTTAADFVWNTGGPDAFRDFSGPAIFAGAPEEAGEALAARDIAGAVVVLLGLPGAAGRELVPDWIRRGVAGVVVLAPDAGYFDLVARSRGPIRYYVDAPVDDPVWQPDLPVIVAGPRFSAALLGDAGDPAAATLPADLDADVDVVARFSRERVPATNVAGVVRGTDAVRGAELVVYTAHYDHLGTGVPDASGDSIYNGFSDNAAGVAMLLAIAERFAAEPPPVSVLFLFLTAEERGLLGSSHFAATPPVPLESIRGVINLDAGAPPAPPVSWRIAAGDDAGEVVAAARAVASRHGWHTEVGPATPNSDHWPFAARGVPAIFLIPGTQWANTTAEEAMALRARWDRYHQQGDRWHPEFPFAGLGRYAQFALEIGRRLAWAP